MTTARRNRGTARKRFGQHFLEPVWVDKLIRAIAPAPEQTFIEIGPGRGALTRALTAQTRRVVAFEIDRDLAAELTRTAPSNLTVVEGDFLHITAEQMRSLFSADELARPIRVAGNLPYNVASPILFGLLALHADGIPLADAHVMLQREVAQRLLARPGTGEYGVLSVLVGHRASVTPVLNLPPGAFRPAPKVHSSVVRLQFHPPDPPVRDERVFVDLVRTVFTKRRKTLGNALGKRLEKKGRESFLARRPETLSIPEFATLADALTDHHRLPPGPSAVL